VTLTTPLGACMLTLILGLKVSVEFLGGKILAAIETGFGDKGPGFDSRTWKVSSLCSDSNVGMSSTQRCELPVCVKRLASPPKTLSPYW
jgi:hypothetical protein